MMLLARRRASVIVDAAYAHGRLSQEGRAATLPRHAACQRYALLCLYDSAMPPGVYDMSAVLR